MTGAAQLLAAARAEVGYVEQPVNRTKFGRWFGMDGQPWCAMFVAWCAARAGIPADVIPRTAWTPAIAAFYQQRGRWAGPELEEPPPGALVLFSFGGTRVDHVGIVERPSVGAQFWTIEGNTSPADDRNGGMVQRRLRSRSRVAGFALPDYPAPEDDVTPQDIDTIVNRLREELPPAIWTHPIPAQTTDDPNDKKPAQDVVGKSERYALHGSNKAGAALVALDEAVGAAAQAVATLGVLGQPVTPESVAQEVASRLTVTVRD